MEWLGPYLPALLFASLAILLFSGYPVAFVLGAVGIFFGWAGIYFGLFSPVQFSNLLPRIYGSAV